MEPVAERIGKRGKIRWKSPPVETAFFDLIGPIQDVVSPEKEKMVTLIVSNLMNRGVLLRVSKLN